MEWRGRKEQDPYFVSILLLKTMRQYRHVLYVAAITLVVTLGGLLFGYDTAVISGAEQAIEVYLIDSLGLGSFAHGLTVSSALIGCIVGGIISGFFSNRIGRKNTLLLAAVLFVLSALGSAYPEFLFFNVGEPTFGVLIMLNLYRILGGIGIGLASATAPTYIGEIAPAHIRGRLVSWYQFAIIFGQLVVYIVNWSIANGRSFEWIVDRGWRYMLASGAIPALLFFLLLFFVPETPRFLVSRKDDQRAFNILEKINGSREKAKEILEDIQLSLRQKEATGHLFSYGKTVVIVGILLSVFQQFVGINVALYYAPRIFESLGAGKNASMLQTVVMGLVNVVFTIVAIQTVDRWGRKPLLISGSVGMAVGMFGVATLAHYNFRLVDIVFHRVLHRLVHDVLGSHYLGIAVRNLSQQNSRTSHGHCGGCTMGRQLLHFLDLPVHDRIQRGIHLRVLRGNERSFRHLRAQDGSRNQRKDP